MRLRLLGVGRPKDPVLGGLHDRYSERIQRLGTDYSFAFVSEVAAGGRYSDEHVRERESQALLDATGGNEVRIALDRTGSLWTSEEVAARLERWSQPAAVFLIGGPLGPHRKLLTQSAATWSLSPLTLTHEWVRALATEQLYRALTLRRGLPYHK